jgi:small conductance mechanosensitive channel
VAAGALLCAPATARAQTFPGISFSTPAPATAVDLAPVTLDGQTLFSVAGAGDAHDHFPAAQRASDITAVLAQIVATAAGDDRTAYDPQTLRITVDREGDQNVLEAVDAHHHDPLPIVTVSSADAGAHGSPADTLAGRWQETLEGALVQALLIRQPAVQQRNIAIAIGVAIALALLTLLAYALNRRLGRAIETLAGEVDGAGAEAGPHTSRRLDLLRALRGALLCALLLAWFGAATWVTLLFPQTTPLGHTILRNALAVAFIWIVTGLIDRLISAAISRVPIVWDLRRFASADERARQALRVPTIVRAMNGFKTVVLVFVAILSTMTQLGIPVGSVVTIGGVAAIAVSLAAQNLFRDIVGGFLVLSEDQYVVGDFVTINGASGIVERLTLRMVQIRDGSGSLVTIAHSAAANVVNHSRNWSRVDYAISVDAASDVEAAIAAMRTTIDELERDPQWHGAFVNPVEWIGVDGLSRDGIVLRARIKTAPLRQFAVQRELNLRMSKAFREAKIGYGAPVPPLT